MKIMKRTYTRPIAHVEEFTPNEYISACYTGHCNISGYVFSDTNGDGKYTPGTDKYKYYNEACGEPYSITGQSSTLPPKNAFIFTNVERNNNGTPWYPYDDYYEGVGTSTPVWNYKSDHTTTTMVRDPKRPNHS